MGLFDFVGDVGKKLFGSEAEAAEKIKSYIEAENPGVANLALNVKDGVATLSGQAESAEAMEKVIQMAGNIQGVTQVNADNLSAPAATEMEGLPILALSSSGELVKQVQAKVGVVADGIFGANTEAAVRAFQSAHGLVPDGIIGPKTWAALDSV